MDLMQTGITCRKTPCYMHDLTWSLLPTENDKIFRNYAKHFLNFPK